MMQAEINQGKASDPEHQKLTTRERFNLTVHPSLSAAQLLGSRQVREWHLLQVGQQSACLCRLDVLIRLAGVCLHADRKKYGEEENRGKSGLLPFAPWYPLRRNYLQDQ